MKLERKGLTTRQEIESMREEFLMYNETGINNTRNQKKGRKRSPLRIVCTIGMSLITVALIIILVQTILLRSSGKIPNIFGYYLFEIESGSMEPTLMVGDLILSKQPSSNEILPVGTIVTFYNEDDLVVTHRIVGIETLSDGSVLYETKGDYEGNSVDLTKLSNDHIIAVYQTTLIKH